MSTPQDSPSPSSVGATTTTTTTLTPDQQRARTDALAQNLLFTLVVGCPIAILWPPRRLDLRTFGLGLVWAVAANEYTARRTGYSLPTQMARRLESVVGGAGMPTERAARVQRLMRERMERERGGVVEATPTSTPTGLEGVVEARRREERERERQRGLLGKVWMGGEEEGWKERRLREEQEALQEGKGYGDLIMQHIWEVWNWGKGEEEGGKPEEEK